MAPVQLTSKILVQQGLPDLLLNGRNTHSDSTQNNHFNSTLGYWGRFEMSARENFKQTHWNDTVLDYAPDSRHDHEYNIHHEQLVCGDEHSVVARFGQNVGHVMTAVLRSSRIDVRFGDYKTVDAEGSYITKVPDIAVLDSRSRMLLMGEAKTPWRHDIKEEEGNWAVFRKYLGQIANYMYLTKRKFGFWTNYSQTVFLKQEKHPTRKGKWVLWHSPVIDNHTNSRQISSQSSNPAFYRGNVSVRECFLYLITLAKQENLANNTMEPGDWVGSSLRAKKDDIISDEDRVTSSSSSEEEGRASRSRPQADDRAARYAARETQRSAASISELESRASRLTIRDRDQDRSRSRSALVWKEHKTDVYYSRSGYWYYESESTRVKVDLLDGNHPTFGRVKYFVLGSSCYPVRQN